MNSLSRFTRRVNEIKAANGSSKGMEAAQVILILVLVVVILIPVLFTITNKLKVKAKDVQRCVDGVSSTSTSETAC